MCMRLVRNAGCSCSTSMTSNWEGEVLKLQWAPNELSHDSLTMWPVLHVDPIHVALKMDLLAKSTVTEVA